MKNMKPIPVLIMLAIASAVSGCVSTTYTQSVSVKKDANGKVIDITETEAVVQPNQQGWPVKFKYLKGVRPGE
jgi:hypothetical protein